MTRPGTRDDRARRLYARLLALYPDDFREQFEADLIQAFDDRRSEPRFGGSLGGFRLVLFLLRDFVTALPMTTRRRDDIGRGVAEVMNDIWMDLKFSVRMLLKNPMFTLAAVTTLALGIGLNAATFSAVHGILLRPLAGVEDPEELVQVYRAWPGIEFGSNSPPHYQDLRDRTTDVFENVASWFFDPFAVSADGRNERVMGLTVSANFFHTYGVEARDGRSFPASKTVTPEPIPWSSSAAGSGSLASARTLRSSGEP